MCAKSSTDHEVAANPKPKRRGGRWKRILLSLLGILVLLLVVLWFSLSAVATWIANKKLPELLNADASVGHIRVYPARGMASIHDLRIGQPEGFGDDALVEVDRVMARVDLKSLTSGEGIIVRDVELGGLKAHVVKDANGALNVLNLVPSSSGDAAEPDPEQEPSEGDTAGAPEPESTKDPLPGIRIERVVVDGVAVQYTDHTPGTRPIDIAFGNLGIELENGWIELAASPKVTLDRGQVTLEDIRIAQPDDFGEDALLALPRLQVEIGSTPFENNLVRLEALELSGLRAHIMRNANGVINASRLGGGPPPPPSAPEAGTGDNGGDTASDEPAEEVAQPTDEIAPAEQPASPPVGVYLAKVSLTDFGVTYTDEILAGNTPMEFVIRDLGLEVQDLMAFLPEPPAPTSAVDFSASLAQGDHPDARIALVAALGPIAGGVPDLNAQFKLTGLMLDVLGSLLPPGVRNALGAEGADLQLGVALNSTSIDLAGTLQTDAGHSYDLKVHGPLDQPSVDLGPLMFAVAGRMVGGVANLATGSAGAALDVAQGVTGGAEEIGKGAKQAIEGVGGGLLKSAAGILRGDLNKVGEGVKGATVGTVKDAASAVGSASDTMVSETKEGVKSATGNKRTAAWLDAGTERHDADVTTARKALGDMPFPPPDLAPPSEGDADADDDG